MYSRSTIKLRLNHWWHMDYFNDVLTTNLGLEHGSCVAVYAGSESSWISSKYLNLCSEDERRSWGWVINYAKFRYHNIVMYRIKGGITHTVSPNLMLILSPYRVVLHPSYLQKVFSFIIFIKERYSFTILAIILNTLYGWWARSSGRNAHIRSSTVVYVSKSHDWKKLSETCTNPEVRFLAQKYSVILPNRFLKLWPCLAWESNSLTV